MSVLPASNDPLTPLGQGQGIGVGERLPIQPRLPRCEIIVDPADRHLRIPETRSPAAQGADNDIEGDLIGKIEAIRI